jgi:hypothetical protein
MENHYYFIVFVKIKLLENTINIYGKSLIIGHYISIASHDDLWLVIGFSRWIAYQFLKKIHGNNEIIFRLKKDMER